MATVAHVLHRLDVAGAEVLAAALARALRGSFDFVFLCLDGEGALAQGLRGDGFAVEALGRRAGVDLRVPRRLRHAVRRHGVDLLHAHQYTPFFYSALSRLPGAAPPILFTEHGRHYPDRRKARRVAVNRLLLRRGDQVTAVAGFVKQALVHNEGLAPDRIEVIPNGIDPTGYVPDPGSRQLLRDQWQVPPGAVVALQVARFHPVKDHATALRALALVPGVVLVLAGDGPEQAALQELAATLGVADRVRFLGLRRDVPALMAAADVFVLSSLSEGLSVTLLEAMAAGLPIAATAVGGNPEVVLQGQTGLLSPRGDAEALAANLRQLAGDPSLRGELGKMGRRHLLDRFTQHAMHAAYNRCYRQMLEPSRPIG